MTTQRSSLMIAVLFPVWLDGTTVKYYVPSGEKLKLNADSYAMFYNLQKLISTDESNIDTTCVTDMSAMFENCMALETLDLSSFDTSNVTSMKRTNCQAKCNDFE